MEEPVQTSDEKVYLLAQVREAFGRVVYSHKTQEKQADLYFRRHRRQQVLFLVLTAVSSGTFLASILGVLVDPQLASLVTSFIALLVTVSTLGAKTFKYADESDSHRKVASRLWDVRESYLSLITDLMSGSLADAQARERRDELQDATRAAYVDAPRTSSTAFAQARKGLKDDQEMTFTPEEIDSFLPEALRLVPGASSR